MYSKSKLFNLALNLLLLQKEITNADNDQSREAKVLRTIWEPGLFSVLEELDLNRTMVTATLELIVQNPNDLWTYAYKYPSNCARIRRIVSGVRKDDESTFIDMGTGQHSGETVIFTDQTQASLEYIPTDIDLSALNAHAGLCVAARLGYLAAPLLIGKEARNIRKDLAADYLLYKLQAQELDSSENIQMDSPALLSPLVRARLE